MNNGLYINAIYRATEGEGVYVGSPQVFVRFQGCAIGCLNCDSKDTWDFNGREYLMSLEEVLEQVKAETEKVGINRISITGGDPLHPKNLPGVISLATELKNRGYWVNIEASGTRVVDSLFHLVDFISFDLKTPSTGVRTPYINLEKMAQNYSGKFQIKAVVEDELDFKEALKVNKTLKMNFPDCDFTFCLTPAYNVNEKFPMERFVDVLTLNEETGAHFRVVGQQHKWIYGPNRKRV